MRLYFDLLFKWNIIEFAWVTMINFINPFVCVFHWTHTINIWRHRMTFQLYPAFIKNFTILKQNESPFCSKMIRKLFTKSYRFFVQFNVLDFCSQFYNHTYTSFFFFKKSLKTIMIRCHGIFLDEMENIFLCTEMNKNWDTSHSKNGKLAHSKMYIYKDIFKFLSRNKKEKGQFIRITMTCLNT